MPSSSVAGERHALGVAHGHHAGGAGRRAHADRAAIEHARPRARRARAHRRPRLRWRRRRSPRSPSRRAGASSRLDAIGRRPSTMSSHTVEAWRDRGMQLEGVYTPVVTPFDERGRDRLRHADARSSSISCTAAPAASCSCGTTGEYYACTFDERVALMTHTRDVAQRRRAARSPAATRARRARSSASARPRATSATTRSCSSAPHTSLPSQRELAGALRRGRRRRRAADRPLQLPGARRRRDRLRVPRRGRRPAGDRRASRSRAATSRASSRCAGATRAGSRSCAARTTRPSTTSRGASAAGSPAPPTCCRRQHVVVIDAAQRGDHARGAPPVRGDAAVDPGHGERRRTTRRRSSASPTSGIDCGDGAPAVAAARPTTRRRAPAPCSTRRSPCRCAESAAAG